MKEYKALSGKVCNESDYWNTERIISEFFRYLKQRYQISVRQYFGVSQRFQDIERLRLSEKGDMELSHF